MTFKTTGFFFVLLVSVTVVLVAQENEKQILGRYQAAASKGGDAKRGEVVFKSKQAACAKCHILSGKERKAGPKLGTIGDKYTRDQLINSVLQPSARIHPDHATTTVVTTAGKTINGVLQSRDKKEVRLLDVEGKLVRIPIGMIELEKPNKISLMPTGIYLSLIHI